MDESIDLNLAIPRLISNLKLELKTLIEGEIGLTDWVIDLFVQESQEGEHELVILDHQV